MKIAISTEGSEVAGHFGRCPEYTIVEVEDDKIISKEKIQNPEHQPGFLPGYLANMGVNYIITGGMGHRAKALFAQYNIEPIIGASGPVDKAIEDFLKGQLVLGESSCDRDKPWHKSCKH